MAQLHVLVRPLVTEKATKLSDVRPVPEGGTQDGAAARGPTYTFEVAPAANKHQIRRAVESQFAVKVAGVRTLILPGKSRRRGSRVYRRPARKKAMVQLLGGQSIDLFAQEG